jgi:hypothetical protein
MLYRETICHISVLNKLKVMKGLHAFTHIWVANQSFIWPTIQITFLTTFTNIYYGQKVDNSG